MAAITGKITDAKTGKPIYNAHVIFTDKKGNPYSPLMGTVTNFDGTYSFDNLGGYYLKVLMLGYDNLVKPIDLTKFQSGGNYANVINFQLQPNSYNLPEVVIKGKRTATPGWWNKNRGIAVLAGLVVVGFIIKHNE